jgi:hypothetical protein
MLVPMIRSPLVRRAKKSANGMNSATPTSWRCSPTCARQSRSDRATRLGTRGVFRAWNPEADRLQHVESLYRSLEPAIKRGATASRARVANMFVALNAPGNLKTQEARLCSLTFFCSKSDPHPTDAGYRAMADAFMTASGYPRK